MKYKLPKAEYEKLSDEIKGEYTLSGDTATLDLEGGPTGADPKAAEKFDKERDRRRAAEKRAVDLEAKIQEIEDLGSVADTEAKWSKKYATLESKLAETNTTHNNYVKTKEVDTVANDLAGKLSRTAAKVLLPHVRSRLDLDMTDPLAPKVTVLGADGKPNGKTLVDLEKEFRDNKDFAGIITANQASGGNASKHVATGNGNPGPGGAPPVNQQATSNLATLKGADLVAHLQAARAAKGLAPLGEQAT